MDRLAKALLKIVSNSSLSPPTPRSDNFIFWLKSGGVSNCVLNGPFILLLIIFNGLFFGVINIYVVSAVIIP